MRLDAGELGVAQTRADAFRAAVEAECWPELAPGLAVTVSIGVAVRGVETDPGRIVSLADTRLYEAKRGGRNRVC